MKKDVEVSWELEVRSPEGHYTFGLNECSFQRHHDRLKDARAEAERVRGFWGNRGSRNPRPLGRGGCQIIRVERRRLPK